MGKAKILIVDDNDHILKLLRISLTKAGYDIVEAHDGDEGYQVALQEKPDLIISDVMMPKTDGIEFCWMIRENSPIPLVPFIFMTSLEDKDLQLKGFRIGADEYLIKPIDREVLLEKVEGLLNRSQKVRQFEEEERGKKEVHGFEGNLADLTLAEVIQLLNLNRRTGTLSIDATHSGRIVFEGGEMIFAEYGNHTGEEAINHLVLEKKGTFRFVPEKADVARNIAGATMNVLLEACRLADESNWQSGNG